MRLQQLQEQMLVQVLVLPLVPQQLDEHRLLSG
jgi:hypothetical protein